MFSYHRLVSKAGWGLLGWDVSLVSDRMIAVSSAQDTLLRGWAVCSSFSMTEHSEFCSLTGRVSVEEELCKGLRAGSVWRGSELSLGLSLAAFAV